MLIRRMPEGSKLTFFTSDGPIVIIVNNDRGANQIKLAMDMPKEVKVEVENALPLNTSNDERRRKIL